MDNLHLIKEEVRRLLESWWDDLSDEEKQKYLQVHPDSKLATGKSYTRHEKGTSKNQLIRHGVAGAAVGAIGTMTPLGAVAGAGAGMALSTQRNRKAIEAKEKKLVDKMKAANVNYKRAKSLGHTDAAEAHRRDIEKLALKIRMNRRMMGPKRGEYTPIVGK